MITETVNPRFNETVTLGQKVFYEMHGGSSFLYRGATVTNISESGVTVLQPNGDKLLLDPENVFVNQIPKNKTIIDLNKKGS